ncbi:hypothetical protein SDC9_160425 [bioreactor metagenome]|uniref:Uncharacterized protein n=1 Tax=bioreactor metagenome TaxID=1076179 RepID=A0A645FFC6_9ZZZZ
MLGVIILPKLGVPSALIILYAVLGGMLSAHFIYKATETKNGTPEKPSKKETV